MNLKSRFRKYAENSTAHGLNYIVNKNVFWTKRMIITIIIVICYAETFLGIKRSYEAYKYNSVSFVTDRNYLKWNTTFPAITVCQMSNSENYSEFLDENNAQVQEFISDIVLFTGSCYSCSESCYECNELNFTQLLDKYRKSCSSLLSTCKYNNIEFDCCEKFLPLNTEYGVCYTINSIYTKKPKHFLKSNRISGPGNLQIKTVDDVRIYIHAPENVPFINSDPDLRQDIILGESFQIFFTISEISNSDYIKYLSVDQKTCRFFDEVPLELKLYNYYSYSSCIVQCRARNHIKYCNCTHHHMPLYSKHGNYCDIAGLECLTQKSEIFNRLRSKNFNRSGIECDCVPSCEESEYNIVLVRKKITPGYSEINLIMNSLPTLRYKRLIVRTKLDLLVSIGSNIGLFTAASILSFVEIIYWFFVYR